MAVKDYYRVLNVPYAASTSTIKSAYRKLVMRYHPDVSAVPNAAEKFKEIVEAYKTLSDAYKRFDYDKQLMPEDFYTDNSDGFRQGSEKDDFSEEPISEKFSNAIKDIFAKIKVNFDSPKINVNYEKRSVKVDPMLKKMNEDELFERLMNSTNYFVRVNAVYALATKNSQAAAAHLQSAYSFINSDSLKTEIIKYMPLSKNAKFIKQLTKDIDKKTDELAKEIIIFLARVKSRESISELKKLKNSSNPFIRSEICNIFQNA